jgi:hypothetical protein
MNTSKEARRLDPEVQAAVAVFLKIYQRGDGPFAISEAMEAVRRIYSILDISDNELTDAIAGEAVAAGVNIYSDGPGKSTPPQAAERWENEGGAIRS